MKRDKEAQAAPQMEADDMLPEYDFSQARPNPYASRYQKGALVVTLDPDVAAVFPSAAEVNEALRALAKLVRKQQERMAQAA